MIYKYGDLSFNQIKQAKIDIRKAIFFLLLLVDPKTKDEYKEVDVTAAFDNLLHMLGGMNSILLEPPELVRVMSLVEAALIEFHNPEFEWSTYRKLILDAGNEIMKVKEV